MHEFPQASGKLPDKRQKGPGGKSEADIQPRRGGVEDKLNHEYRFPGDVGTADKRRQMRDRGARTRPAAFAGKDQGMKFGGSPESARNGTARNFLTPCPPRVSSDKLGCIEPTCCLATRLNKGQAIARPLFSLPKQSSSYPISFKVCASNCAGDGYGLSGGFEILVTVTTFKDVMARRRLSTNCRILILQ